jgi:hypothetical protein
MPHLAEDRSGAVAAARIARKLAVHPYRVSVITGMGLASLVLANLVDDFRQLSPSTAGLYEIQIVVYSDC